MSKETMWKVLYWVGNKSGFTLALTDDMSGDKGL